MNRAEYLKAYMRKWYANIKENQPERYRAMRDRENKVRRDKWRDDAEYRENKMQYVRIWKKINKEK